MKNTLAIIYDFDLTLSPVGMQDFGLFQKLKTTEDEFMKEVREFAKEHNSDFLLSFMLNISQFKSILIFSNSCLFLFNKSTILSYWLFIFSDNNK